MQIPCAQKSQNKWKQCPDKLVQCEDKTPLHLPFAFLRIPTGMKVISKQTFVSQYFRACAPFTYFWTIWMFQIKDCNYNNTFLSELSGVSVKNVVVGHRMQVLWALTTGIPIANHHAVQVPTGTTAHKLSYTHVLSDRSHSGASKIIKGWKGLHFIRPRYINILLAQRALFYAPINRRLLCKSHLLHCEVAI